MFIKPLKSHITIISIPLISKKVLGKKSNIQINYVSIFGSRLIELSPKVILLHSGSLLKLYKLLYFPVLNIFIVSRCL